MAGRRLALVPPVSRGRRSAAQGSVEPSGGWSAAQGSVELSGRRSILQPQGSAVACGGSASKSSISDDDERMSVGSRGSVRAEDRDYLEKGSRAASALSSATLASLGGTSSRRGSGDTSITADTEASIREIKEIHELKDQIQDVESKYMQNLKGVKDALVEVEEKYRRAMVSNAQLDNEKNNLMYQTDTLKDSLLELEELLAESRREYEEKAKEYEREKHAHGVLQFQHAELKETLKQSEDLLTKHGIVLGPDLLATNGETAEAGSDGSAGGDSASRLAQDCQTSTEGNSILEIRLRKLVDERENLIGQVKKLKAQVEQKQPKNGTEDGSSPHSEVLENGNDPHIQEVQRDASRQLSDLKFKLVKAEQEITALEQNVSRLDGQVLRYKSASENSERIEDELKAEKRKLQRELRTALDKIDELESNNSHLSKRLDKMKSSRTAATP